MSAQNEHCIFHDRIGENIFTEMKRAGTVQSLLCRRQTARKQGGPEGTQATKTGPALRQTRPNNRSVVSLLLPYFFLLLARDLPSDCPLV